MADDLTIPANGMPDTVTHLIALARKTGLEVHGDGGHPFAGINWSAKDWDAFAEHVWTPQERDLVNEIPLLEDEYRALLRSALVAVNAAWPAS